MKHSIWILAATAVVLSSTAQAGILTCTTQETKSRQFILVVDAFAKPSTTSSGLLFQSVNGAANQIYPGVSTRSGHDIKAREDFLTAFDSSEVKWEDDECFRVVGSQFRFRVSQTVPPGVETLVGDLEETIGARINPKGRNCPNPSPPRPEHFQITCKPF